MAGQLYKYIHSSPEIRTIGDLVANERVSVAYAYYNDPDGFLAILGPDGLTNRQRIEKTFRFPEEKKNIGLPALKLPIKTGTLLYLEYDKVQELSFITEGIEIVSTNEPAFKAKALADLESDKGYTQTIKPLQGEFQKGTYKESYPECTVWIWCRGITGKENDDTELTGQIFDISPFVMSCTTNIDKQGGNFQITLPPIPCELDVDRKWVIKWGALDAYDNNPGASIQGQGFVSHASILYQENEELVRTQMLFHNMIQTNDLIFIRFETLDMERDQRYYDAQSFYVNKNNIPGRIYDMIGLVDKNVQVVNPQNNTVTINLSGRDLSKLFIEDGTYFYALENSQGILKFSGQSEQKNQLLNRIYGNGANNFLALYFHTSIELVMKFIIQQLANIEVIPDHLFSAYGDRVNKRFKVYDVQSKSNQPYKPLSKIEDAAGIWKIIKLVIDESVSDRRIQDNSFSQAKGSLLNFLHTLCKEPLVEFYMDTYGDMYHLIVRKPPFDQKALISLIEGKVNTETGETQNLPAIIDIEQEDVISENLSFEDKQIYSWYHFYPKANFFGPDNSYSLNYLGALHFEEYAEIWGSKPYQRSHPYLAYAPLNNSEKGASLYENQAIQDLKYVVESHQYLPFTRKGTLILNRDRRIKIGNVIRYKSTGEIFFVDSVQQSYRINNNSIEATTTVMVSRGMIEQLIYGAFFKNDAGEKRFVSYFNIINTDLVIHQKSITKTETKRRLKKHANTATNIQGGITPIKAKPTFAPFLADQFGNVQELDDAKVIETGNNKGLGYLDRYDGNIENKNLFIRFINAINASGYWVELGKLSTQRTTQEQWQLKYGENGNLSNAAPGHSRHEHYAAIDIVAINKKTGERHGKVSSKEGWIKTGIPALAKSMGLQWAGGEGSFGSYVDRVHFQIINASNLNKSDADAALEEQYEEYTETTTTKTLDRDKVFTNFKVNKFTFNFFLKKLQFDPSYRKVTSREWEFKHDQVGSPVDAVVSASRKKKN